MSREDNGKGQADLAHIQSAASAGSDQPFWRSLDEAAGNPSVEKLQANEFAPGAASRFRINRRDAMKLLGASAALAGLTACTKMPLEKIVPYVNAPEEFEADKPLFYATTMPWNGAGQGVLAWSFLGRPTKIEGNNENPGSVGKANVFMQASVLDLYDPDRSQVVLHSGRLASWNDFLVEVQELRAAHLRSQGAGLRILTGTVTSPAMGDQLADILKQFPKAQWHQFESVNRDNARAGAKMAFGEMVETVYHFDQADIVVSLDSDFMFSLPGSLRYAHDFANKRRVTTPESPMNRFYAVEATGTITGVQADHRLRLRPSQVEPFARMLASAVGVAGVAGAPSEISGVPSNFVAVLASELKSHSGTSVIVAGDSQPPAVHVLAHAMNATLGNVGKTVVYTDSIEVNPVIQTDSLKQLVSDMQAGQVDTLMIFGGNPVYMAPADVPFAEALAKVRNSIYLGLYEDETAELCLWHVPAAHYLESWGDLRTYDGTVSTMQPLIAPLYDGKSGYELLTLLQGQLGRTSHTIVRDFWQAQLPKLTPQQFEVQWETWLEKGIVENSALAPKKVTLAANAVSAAPVAPAAEGLEIVFMPDPTIWDGSFTNNGWLQELAKPLVKLTWDNAVMVSPATFERLGREMKQVKVKGPGMGHGTGGRFNTLGPTEGHKNTVVELTFQGRKVLGPLLLNPGQADDCLVVTLGYGRMRAGRLGTGTGFNAGAIRPSSNQWFGSGVEAGNTGSWYRLAVTQQHHLIDLNKMPQSSEIESNAAFYRDLVRVNTIGGYRKDPKFAMDPPSMTTNAKSLYPVLQAPYDFKKSPQWGMSIDLGSCIGCNACIIACQAENNIAVVGKDQVARGREMQWIRVDTYYRGDTDKPEIYNEPVPCMQCENAPCEYVCPVGATVTGPEGINEQIYNRCVGTRYCSNNCPYKVRRFNFYLFADWNTPSLYPLRNPRVTVRSRGVMEKCTYCIQRIRAHEIEAEEQNRKLVDGEILTACQQTCPTDAIVFGDILNPKSKVAKLRTQPRKYGLLEELNTRPRTTYLAKLWNPNPEI